MTKKYLLHASAFLLPSHRFRYHCLGFSISVHHSYAIIGYQSLCWMHKPSCKFLAAEDNGCLHSPHQPLQCCLGTQSSHLRNVSKTCLLLMFCVVVDLQEQPGLSYSWHLVIPHSMTHGPGLLIFLRWFHSRLWYTVYLPPDPTVLTQHCLDTSRRPASWPAPSSYKGSPGWHCLTPSETFIHNSNVTLSSQDLRRHAYLMVWQGCFAMSI